MNNSQTTKDALESLQFLTPDEAAELDMLLAEVTEPMTMVTQIVRPDGSTQGYLLHTRDGYVEMPADHPLLEGYPPVTPESENGGFREGERL